MELFYTPKSYFLFDEKSLKYVPSLRRIKSRSFKYLVFSEYIFEIFSEDNFYEYNKSSLIWTSLKFKDKIIFWGLPENILNQAFKFFKIKKSTIFPFYLLKKHIEFRNKSFLFYAFSKIYFFYKGLPLYNIYQKYFSFEKLRYQFESQFETDIPPKLKKYYLKDILNNQSNDKK